MNKQEEIRRNQLRLAKLKKKTTPDVPSDEKKLTSSDDDRQPQRLVQTAQSFARKGQLNRTSTPVQPTRTSAPVQPTRMGAPVQPTRTNAPVQPTRTNAPVQPTRASAPVQPTRMGAPVQPTRMGAPVQPTRTSALVQPTRMGAPLPIKSMSKPSTVIYPKTVLELQNLKSKTYFKIKKKPHKIRYAERLNRARIGNIKRIKQQVHRNSML